MLEKERFLAIKKLARDIREDNKNLFKKIEKKDKEEAVQAKNDFIESLISTMDTAFSDGEQGKEERQIFRANLLIPDDDEFYKTYSENKNIRNLMGKYAVNIEDVMSKITELNIYGKYLEEEPEDIEEETNFIDEMVKISPKEAEDLLDEIDDLSNTLTNLDLTSIKQAASIEIPEEPEVEPEEEKPKAASFIKKEIKEEVKELEEEPIDIDIDIDADNVLDESFDSINKAISGFITDYNSIKDEVKDKDDEIKNLQGKVRKLNSENEKLTSENNDLHSRQSEYRQENNKLKSENEKLKSDNKKLKSENQKMNNRMKVLEDKLIKTAALLNKVYDGIHKN